MLVVGCWCVLVYCVILMMMFNIVNMLNMLNMLFVFCCNVMVWCFGNCWNVKLVGYLVGVNCVRFVSDWKFVVRFVVVVLLKAWLVSSLFCLMLFLCCDLLFGVK